MIEYFDICAKSLRIVGGLGGHHPKYLYLDHKNYRVYFLRSLKEIEAFPIKLEVDPRSLSLLLQLSYIIPPNTIYKNLLVVNIGDEVVVKKTDSGLSYTYCHSFPFAEEKRLSRLVNVDELLVDLNTSLLRNSRSSKKFLFHTAGKDSNSILASCLVAGNANDLILVSAKSQNNDESVYSSSIADKFGIKHIALDFELELSPQRFERLVETIGNLPFPNVDSLMVPLCLYGFDNSIDFHMSDCIFGDGNDGYFLSLPSKKETLLSPVTNFLSVARHTGFGFLSGSKLNNLFRTKLEWSGAYGFSYVDLKLFYPDGSNLVGSALEDWNYRSSHDRVTAKSDAYATRPISQRMIQKLDLFCHIEGANLCLPFADDDFISKWGYLSADCLHDKGKTKNKVILRKIVKNIIGLDTDKVGKLGWSFDYITFVEKNVNYIRSEIVNSKWWNSNMSSFFDTLYNSKESLFMSRLVVCKLICSLFVVSVWLNRRGN